MCAETLYDVHDSDGTVSPDMGKLTIGQALTVLRRWHGKSGYVTIGNPRGQSGYLKSGKLVGYMTESAL